MFAVATSLATTSDVLSLVTAISENLVANLPFILGIVGFGIVYKIVVSKLKTSEFWGGSIHDTISNYRNYR